MAEVSISDAGAHGSVEPTDRIPASKGGVKGYHEIGDILAFGGLSVSRVTANAAALRNAFTSPIELVPAQGAGKIIIPAFVFVRYTPGSFGFGETDNDSFFTNGVESTNTAFTTISDLLKGTVAGALNVINDGAIPFPITPDGSVVWTAEDAPLLWKSSVDWTFGHVATVDIGDNAGADYAPGDEVYTDITSSALFVVDSVDGGGAVTGISVSSNDFAPPGTNLATQTNNAGTGLTLDITVNPGDGSAEWTTLYFVA